MNRNSTSNSTFFFFPFYHWEGFNAVWWHSKPAVGFERTHSQLNRMGEWGPSDWLNKRENDSKKKRARAAERAALPRGAGPKCHVCSPNMSRHFFISSCLPVLPCLILSIQPACQGVSVPIVAPLCKRPHVDLEPLLYCTTEQCINFTAGPL